MGRVVISDEGVQHVGGYGVQQSHGGRDAVRTGGSMGLMRVLDYRSRWYVRAKFVKMGGGSVLEFGLTRLDPGTLLEERTNRRPDVNWQEGALGERETNLCLENLREYAVGRVVQSSRKTFEGGRRMLLGWRNSIGTGCWLREGASEMELVDELVDELVVIRTYRCAGEGTKKEQ